MRAVLQHWHMTVPGAMLQMRSCCSAEGEYSLTNYRLREDPHAAHDVDRHLRDAFRAHAGQPCDVHLRAAPPT